MAIWINRDPVTRYPVARSSPHVLAWWCTATCRKDLYTIPGSWKCPSSSMTCVLTRHVSRWACLECSVLTCTTACSKFPSISSNFAQPFHRPQSTAWSTLCKRNGWCCMRQIMVTPDTDWFSDSWPYLFFIYLKVKISVTNRCICVFPVHRLGPNDFISIDWFPYMNCNSVKPLKLLHVAFIFFVLCIYIYMCITRWAIGALGFNCSSNR